MKLQYLLVGLLVLLVGCKPTHLFGTPTPDEAGVPTESSDSTASPVASDQLITADQLGPAKLGMTLGELKEQLGSSVEFVADQSFMVDLGAIAVRQNGEDLFYILYFANEPLTDDSPIELLLTTNPQFRTQQGIGPGSQIADAEQTYGQATLSFSYANEMRESVQFANFPDVNVVFRTNGFQADGQESDEMFAGIYDESAGEEFLETTDYRPEATIRAVMVDGYRMERSNQPLGDKGTQDNGKPQNNDGKIDCTNPVGTAAINHCAEDEYKAQDAKLNQVYQQAIASLNEDGKTKLIAAERAWLEFRDSNCDYQAHQAAGGEGHSAFVNTCLTVMTSDRTKQLELPQFDSLVYGADSNSPQIGVVTVDGQQIDCDNANSTVEINYCSGLVYERDDNDLNQVYQTVITDLNEESKAKLRSAQQDWIAFRDAQCDFEVRDAIGGTGYSSYLSSCLAKLTRQRTADLQNPDGRMLPF